MLVGQEQHALALLESPSQHGVGVGGGAYRAAVAPAEGFDAGDGVHIGYGDDFVGAEGFVQVLPGILYIIHRRHIGHRTAGGDVGQDYALVGGGEDAGGFGHKVDAAKDDVVGIGAAGGLLRQQERVALKIGVFDHFLALVVVAEDGYGIAQLLAGGVNAGVQLLGGITLVFGGDLLPADVYGQLLLQRLGGQIILGFAKGGMFQFGDGYDGAATGNHR